MPRDVRDWLPPEHLCWKVLDVVELLDLSAFENSYRDDGRGGVAYPPARLIALLLYCYSKGVRSSRRIERACWDDVRCRIITANRRVDHSTVARFVRRHRAALHSPFVQVLSLCGRSGLVDLSAAAVDGSGSTPGATVPATCSPDPPTTRCRSPFHPPSARPLSQPALFTSSERSLSTV
jgi:transposase